MQLVDVQSRDIYVLFEISLSDLKKLEFIIRNSTLDYDGKIPEEAEAAKYLTDKFYPLLQKTLQDVG